MRRLDKITIALSLTILVALFGLKRYRDAQRDWTTEHRHTVFQEQVDHHHCKVTPYWKDGKPQKGNLCILPDGTILMTEAPMPEK